MHVQLNMTAAPDFLSELCALPLTATLCGQVTDQYNERWRSDWITSDFWHVLNFIFLCVIAFLWRPSAHATRFAYSALDGMYLSTCTLVKLFGLVMLHFSDTIMLAACLRQHSPIQARLHVHHCSLLTWYMLTCILHLATAVVVASYHTQPHLTEFGTSLVYR